MTREFRNSKFEIRNSTFTFVWAIRGWRLLTLRLLAISRCLIPKLETGLPITARLITTVSYEKRLAASLDHGGPTQIRKLCCAPIENGAMMHSRDCAVCLPSRFGTRKARNWCWLETRLAS